MAVLSGGNADQDGFSEINVTPLTDVLLVLLIIFLITGSSITAPAHQIELPEVMTKEKAANASIMIDVLPNGKTYVGNLEVPIEEMEGVLSRMAAERQTDRVIVNADESTPYAPVMAAMEAARNSGLENIALATEMDKAAPRNQDEAVEAKVEEQTPKVEVRK